MLGLEETNEKQEVRYMLTLKPRLGKKGETGFNSIVTITTMVMGMVALTITRKAAKHLTVS